MVSLPDCPNDGRESKYNSRRQRVWRSENGTAERLVYDSQKLIAEATSTALNRYYLSEGGSVYSPLLAQLGSEHWFLADALGTTLGLTSPAGSLTDTFKYEAFGTSLGRTGTTATPYQYVGGYGYFNEPSVGLEQVWWRWLTTSAGLWSSTDALTGFPAGISGSGHLAVIRQQVPSQYPYVSHSPSLFIDPTGLVRLWPGRLSFGWCWTECEADAHLNLNPLGPPPLPAILITMCQFLSWCWLACALGILPVCIACSAGCIAAVEGVVSSYCSELAWQYDVAGTACSCRFNYDDFLKYIDRKVTQALWAL